MKIDVPMTRAVNSAEIVRAAQQVRDYLRNAGVAPTLGASGCLMLFAAMLKASGHPEQEGHNALDRMFHILKMLDTEKPS